jgi:uncharacterized membrane protein YphA (DoxX/SURF4 family)
MLLAFFLRLVIGIIFLQAGLTKILELGVFVQTVRAYAILPNFLIPIFAVVVPWVELTIGACLVLGLWTRWGALGSLLLLLCFMTAIGINLYRGVDISCGCASWDSPKSSLPETLVRDFLLVLGSLFLITIRHVPFSMDSFRSRD